MRNLRAARRYAAALMSVAEETRSIDRIGDDLELIRKTLNASRELRLFVVSPIISPGKKKVVFAQLFGPRVSRETAAFIDLLVTKQRLSVLPDMIEEFGALRDQKLGIVTVGVTSAVELAGPQEQSLRRELERYTGKKVRVQKVIDSGIRGGLRLQVGDTVLDASVRRQLERMRERFIRGGETAAQVR